MAIFYILNVFNFLITYYFLDGSFKDIGDLLISKYGINYGIMVLSFLLVGIICYWFIFILITDNLFYPDKPLKEIELDNLRKDFERDRNKLFKQYKLNSRKIINKK